MHLECSNPRVFPKPPGFYGHIAGRGRVEDGPWSLWRFRIGKRKGSHKTLLMLDLLASEEGCPEGMELVTCTNHCPRRCSDLQEGVACQDGQTCKPGYRCSEGDCGRPFRHVRVARGRQVRPGYKCQTLKATSPQGPWSRMAAACQLDIVSAQMPGAAAGPQEASTRTPATTARARPGSSPVPLSPAHLPFTVPGVAGLPGVPAATHVGLGDSRATSGMGLDEIRCPHFTRVSLCLACEF